MRINNKDMLVSYFSQRKQFKGMSRSDEIDNQGQVKAHYYSLNTFLSLDFPPCRLYELYFHSYYKKTYKSNSVNQQIYNREGSLKSISIFYGYFIEYLYLHLMLLDHFFPNLQSLVDAIIDKKWKDRQLFAVTEQLMRMNIEKYKEKIISKREKSYPQVEKILNYISKMLKECYQSITFNFEGILETEYLPAFIKQKNDLFMYVKKSFEKLRNLNVLWVPRKMELKIRMFQDLKNYWVFQNSSYDPKSEKIKTPPESKQRQPILTSMINYVSLRKTLKKNPQNVKGIRRNSLQLCKDIYLLCKYFRDQTGKVFPSLSLDNMMFDQKSLRVVLKNKALIYDALGVTDSSQGSIELEIAMSPTPSLVQYEKCIREFDEKVKWTLRKKYYVEKNDYEENQEDSEVNFESIPLEKEIAEEIHVWRLICVFYFIIKEGKHLIKDEYSKEKESKQPPIFVEQKYQAVLSALHSKISSNRSYLYELLGESRPGSPSKPEKFSFTLKDFNSVVRPGEDIEDEDELFEALRFDKIKEQLFVRFALGKELFAIFSQEKYFKRLINSKKYVLMFLVTIMNSFFQPYIINKAEKEFQFMGQKCFSRREIQVKLYVGAYSKMLFLKQFEKRKESIEHFLGKTKKYLQRGAGDENYRYLNNASVILGGSKEKIYKIMEDLFDKINYMRKMEEELEKYKYSDGQKKKMFEILIAESFNKISQVLSQIVKQDFLRIDKIDDFHKRQQKTKKEEKIFFFLNKKLVCLLNTILNLNESNWRMYANFVVKALVDSRILGLKSQGKKIEELTQAEIDESIVKIDQIEEIMKNEKPFAIIL